MNKTQVLKILKDVLLQIKNEEFLYKKTKLKTIEDKYLEVINHIENDTLVYNEIHNSVKDCFEIYNGYDNPLFYKMSDAEEAVSQYLIL